MAKEKKLLFLAIVVVMVGIAAGFLYWKNNQKETPAPSNIEIPSPPPAVQSPTVSSFSAVVKEVKNGTLLIEIQDSNPQNIEIPLDKNVTFEAWVYKDGKSKPPTRQSAASSDLKMGQKLDIFRTEASNNQPVYEITILNDLNE